MSSPTNNLEFKNSLIIEILNDSIDKLNKLNKPLVETHQLNRLTPTQETIFCDIFNSYYNKVKKTSNDIFTYNPSKNTYNIKLKFQNYPQDKIVNYELTENEFIKLIIDSILFSMFKFNGKTVWTRDLNDNNVLIKNTVLKENYHYLMSKLSSNIFESQESSIKLQELADDYSRSPINNTSITYNQTLLPRPKTPDNGWPSLRKGGSTKRRLNKKRKYSPNKSSSRKNKRKRIKKRLQSF
jgi:hypothetical protein